MVHLHRGETSLAPWPLEVTSLFSTRGFIASSWKSKILITQFLVIRTIITARVGYFSGVFVETGLESE